MVIAAPVFSSNIIKDSVVLNEQTAQTQLMLNRIKHIKELDKSVLKPAERKNLRQEVREIKKTLKANNQGVHLSVGAIIIIILLLILIL